MRERTSDDGKFKTFTDIRDAAFDSLPQNFGTFFFVSFVFGGSRCERFPRFVWFSSRGVNVDDMFAFRADGFVEERGDEEGAKILGVL